MSITRVGREGRRGLRGLDGVVGWATYVRCTGGGGGSRAPGRWWWGGVGETDTATAARANTSRGVVDGDGIVRFGGIRRACCSQSARPSFPSPSVRPVARSFVRSCAARTRRICIFPTNRRRACYVLSDDRSRVPRIVVGAVFTMF